MLASLRKTAGGIVGLFLIALLVFAFALWGIADTFTGFSNQIVAKVGDQELTRNEFRLRYSQQLAEVSRQIGEPLSPGQARGLGLDRQVLANMVGLAALANAGDELGLALDDKRIAEIIVRDPSFHGPNGTFDEPTFRAVLARNGLTEAMFVEDQRAFHIRQQLLGASLDRALVPQKLVEKMYNHFLESRVAKYVVLTLDETDDVGEPTVEELETFYAQTKMRYTEPERRSASFLVITPERFAENIDISELELAEEYEMSIDEFSIEEKRDVDQLVIADEAMVEEVRAMLEQDQPFVEIVDKAGQTLDNTDLGTVTRGSFISADLADEAFAMELGAVSDIIEGPLGYVVLRVRKIIPGEVRPLAEVRDALRRRLALDRAIEDLIAFSETVEDERAAGVTLEEISQRFDLDIVQLSGFDRDGRSATGSLPRLFMQYDSLPGILFDSAEGEEIALQEMEDGTYIWPRLDSVATSRVRPLDDVRETAIAQWQLAERRTLLEAMAEHLVKQGNRAGFAAIEKETEKDPLTSEPMTRQVSNETFSETAVAKLFRLEKGGFAWAPVGFGSELVVMQASDIIAPPTGENAASDMIFDGEKQKYRADLTAQFVNSLEKNYGVSVNQTNYDQMLNSLTTQ